jgi:hypothetical protein
MTKSSSVFDTCVEEIDAEYQRLGHALGWRFLSVSREVLNGPVQIALVTLNPAGDHIPSDHPWASCEDGVSYLVETWGANPPGKSKLQIQVQEMFRLIHGLNGFNGTYQNLMASSLIAHLVPFRSPRLADLGRKAESLSFGQQIWRTLLSVARPKLVICLGREAQGQLRMIVPEAMSARLVGSTSHRTGWGHYTADVDAYEGKYGALRLLFLPHLSTWSLFTSDKCRDFMPAIIRDASRDL